MTTKRKTDKQRIDFLEKMEGWALVSDDFGHWALVTNGIQNIPDETPGDLDTVFYIDKDEWKDSVREAIDSAMNAFKPH